MKYLYELPTTHYLASNNREQVQKKRRTLGTTLLIGAIGAALTYSGVELPYAEESTQTIGTITLLAAAIYGSRNSNNSVKKEPQSYYTRFGLEKLVD